MFVSVSALPGHLCHREDSSMLSASQQRSLLPTTWTTTNLSSAPSSAIPQLTQAFLENWQRRLANHQAPLFRNEASEYRQGVLLPIAEDVLAEQLQPLQLEPLRLDFWSWPSKPYTGPAIYLVTDQPATLRESLLLYIGETGAAEKRWKGSHDCKDYLSAYSEALHAAGLQPQLSIRFWMDVPALANARRQLEQSLIRRWLPPFNKEARRYWSTPFTTASVAGYLGKQH